MVSTAAMQVITGFLPLDLEIIRAGIRRNISKNILVQWRNHSFERTEELKEKKNIDNDCGKIRMEITLKWQKRWET